MISRDYLQRLELEVGLTFHPSLREFLSSYWFGAIGGYFRGVRGVQLDPVVPDQEPTALLQRIRGYQEAHGGRREKIPIGLETSEDLLLVVDNETGRVEVEDYERGCCEPIAQSLAELIRELRLSRES